MNNELARVVADWRRADEDARAAESLVDRAVTLYLHWDGPAPTEHLVNEVSALRSKADAKLRATYRAIESDRTRREEKPKG